MLPIKNNFSLLPDQSQTVKRGTPESLQQRQQWFLLFFLAFSILPSACVPAQNAPPEIAAQPSSTLPTSTLPEPANETPAPTPTTEPTIEAPAEPPPSNIVVKSPYDLPLKLPGAAVVPQVSNGRDLAEIAAIRAKQQKYPTYAALRRLGDIYLKNFAFAEAAKARRAEAAMYRAALAKEKSAARQDTALNSALVVEQEAARYETSLQVFRERQASDQEIKLLYRGAKLEPIVGCYLGAFIDRDDQLKDSYFDENWQSHKTAEEFTKVAGVALASHFMYVSYGQKFPLKWIERCKAANVIPHIAWEPTDIKAVRDDAYLRGWAKAARATDWPLFIRFAGEMNGFWTPYSKNPALYKEKFRLVHRVFRETAPLAATIWCVGAIPVDTIPLYYPGDDGCDWVGVNLYSVPFYDNNPQRPALLDNPTTLLEPIYKLYAQRKPIAICEYAASHRAAADRKLREDFAIDKMAQMYSALPALFPRVKMINWFDANNLVHAKAGRQLNNYNLTERPKIIEQFRQIAQSPYFLRGPEHLADQRPALPFVFNDNATISLASSFNNTARFVVTLKTYVSRPKVYAALNDKLVYASNRPGAHNIDIDLTTLKTGAQTLKISIFDDKNRFITTTQRKFIVSP